MLFWFLTIVFNGCHWHCITKIDLHFSFCRIAMVTRHYSEQFCGFFVLILLAVNVFLVAGKQQGLILFADLDNFLYFSKWKSLWNLCLANTAFQHKLLFPLCFFSEKCRVCRVFASAFLCSFIISFTVRKRWCKSFKKFAPVRLEIV